MIIVIIFWPIDQYDPNHWAGNNEDQGEQDGNPVGENKSRETENQHQRHACQCFGHRFWARVTLKLFWRWWFVMLDIYDQKRERAGIAIVLRHKEESLGEGSPAMFRMIMDKVEIIKIMIMISSTINIIPILFFTMKIFSVHKLRWRSWCADNKLHWTRSKVRKNGDD